VTARTTGSHIFAGEYFAEEVRREIYDRYGEKKLYEGGLSVRTTLDPKLQQIARKALVDGMIRYDERAGYRGAVQKLDISGDWGVKLSDIKALSDIGRVALAVVLETSDQSARIGFQPPREPGGAVVRERRVGIVPLEGVRGRRPQSRPAARQGTCQGQPGAGSRRRDLCRAARRKNGRGSAGIACARFRKSPAPRRHGPLYRPRARDGRRLLVRPEPVQPRDAGAAASRARRSSRSSTRRPSTTATRRRPWSWTRRSRSMWAMARVWRPENYSAGKFYGPQTLRFGIERSRNVMTVRLANDVGMPLIAEYAKRFGVYDDMPSYLSYSLGAGETTVMRMTAAYSMFANGGRASARR
jgi:penicillin-binding protein 1A